MSDRRLSVEHHLASVDWTRLLVDNDRPASAVPDAFRALLGSATEEEADGWYWQLDNNVVVQGNLYSSAPPLVPALVAAMALSLPASVRSLVLELLVQIVSGESHRSAVERGHPDLGPRCRRAACDAIALGYQLAQDDNAETRQQAVWLVHKIDPDRARVNKHAEQWRSDPDPSVRRVVEDMAQDGEPMF